MKYFIGQCLLSVKKAIVGLEAEVIVIDNNSSDESVSYLEKKFSWITLISNKENVGYARANNQGLQIAQGDYILFLNPDTIIGEDCLSKSINVLQKQNDVGALGTCMIDGTGDFLPESKRGFPSPWASFFKLSGLIHVFPRSKIIAQYYMGWLPRRENNAVEVLSGAYMMIKKEVLEKTGGFDEQFFMYGEDIDLSYRISQAGYKNYYFGKNAIIHFKGESTKKDFRYTRLFYKAMEIFVKKHYKNKSRRFIFFMRIGISVSGGLSFLGRLFNRKATAPSIPEIIQTILAGNNADAKKAAEILAINKQAARKIIYADNIAALNEMIHLHKADEIIFCAGVLNNKDIIQYIENAKGNIDYRFFGAGSNCIVSSMFKSSSGEIIVLPEKE